MTVIIIDNKSYTANPDHNLLEAALAAGIDVPYFCWHPAMGSVGSCRQCAVQQFANPDDQKGRMVMACMTPVKDGTRFSVDHPGCRDFRKSVIEWLMINHPHDCPVCDEGGECHLQDMTVMTGHNYRRNRFAKRTFLNQNLGPFINHEMNRCITCYRCVRYYKDVAGGDDLSAFASSGRVYFGRFEEGTLQNPFSGNLVEVCPTGVFTDKVYHQHYTRKWDLETAPSICQLCSLGCNISPGARSQVLRRVQNRFHHDINGFFICDKGRFGHEFVNAQERIVAPLVKGAPGITLSEAKEKLTSLVKKGGAIGIGSPRASLEANWALKQLVGPDNFYDGINPKEAESSRTITSLLMNKTLTPASLKDIRESDCIVVLGEDITNTAPMMALSIRQAHMALQGQTAHHAVDVAKWHDAAIKNCAGTQVMPLFVATPYETDLDSIAQKTIRLDPDDVLETIKSLIQACGSTSNELTHTNAWINEAAAALKQAKNPIIISGTSLYDENLIKMAYNLAVSVPHSKLALVVPECNTVGLLMLKPKPLAQAIERITTQPIDTAIVLENDLVWRLGEKQFTQLEKGVKNLVVLDCLHTETVKSATMVVPVSSFAESTGSLISSEGRLQRYFSVFKNQHDLESSFHVLNSCIGPVRCDTIDDATAFLAADLNIPASAFDQLFHASLKLLGKGIPRQMPKATGRTALTTHLSMHEQKPAFDRDSPLVYSMEGARKKIPLPLIANYSEPGWNSLQSAYKKDLGILHPAHDKPGGVRLFEKSGTPAPVQVHYERGAKSIFPEVLVIPGFNLFANTEHARFAKAVALRVPLVEALISKTDAEKHQLPDNIKVVLETITSKFALTAKAADIPAGTVVLPFGVIDPAVFFEQAKIRVVSEECV